MLQKQLVDKLEKVQRTAVELIDNKNTIDETFNRFKVMKFSNMIQFEQCKMGYKLCHELLQKQLRNNMTKDHNNRSIVKSHRYPTGSKTTPNLPKASSSKYRSSFLYHSVRENSLLDTGLRNSKNLNIFIKRG